ncbi:hypothetical protein [Celeribacter sp. SCSIO 80788]
MQNFFKSLAFTFAALMVFPALAESDDPLHSPQFTKTTAQVTPITPAD